MAKAKQPQQTKAKLKSIVKVVKKNSTTAAATKKVSFCQGPAPPVDHQPVEQLAAPPRQTAFADAMAHWKLSMVAAINSCPSPPQHQVTRITRAHRATMFYFSKVAQWFRRTGAGIIQYRCQYTVNLLWWLLGTLTVDLALDLVTKIALIFHSRYHWAMWGRTWALVRLIWRWTMRIMPAPSGGVTQ